MIKTIVAYESVSQLMKCKVHEEEDMKKVKVLAAIMMIAAMLVGCGGKEIVLKDFPAGDGSYSIQMNEEWIVEDMGDDSWVAAFNEIGSEGGMVMQFTKEMLQGSITDLAGFKEIVESSYVMSDLEALEVSNAAFINSEAYTCGMNVDNLSGEGCVAYGETDYAFYVILTVKGGTQTDAEVESFKKVVASFTETAQ